MKHCETCACSGHETTALQVQDVMHLVFEYARIMSGFENLEGPERDKVREQAAAKDKEIRAAIVRRIARGVQTTEAELAKWKTACTGKHGSQAPCVPPLGPSEPLGHSCRDGWRIGEMKDCALCAPENGTPEHD